MAELQPGDGQQPYGGVPPPPETTSVEAPVTSAKPIISEICAGSKRLRRPSVRFGDIGGDQKPSGRRKNPNPTGKASRTRTLTNLSTGYETSETLDDEREGNVNPMIFGSWGVKKRVGPSAGLMEVESTKRVRSNWVPKMDETRNNFDDGDEKFSGGEELGNGYRDFSREDSESPSKEQSPENSMDNRNERDEFYVRKRYGSNANSRNRVSDDREFESTEPSDMDGGGGGGGGRDREGVKIWLEELGFGRYWPVFEIHEVDEEVLPFLTSEDLKDMGITAVGSRRRMLCAIQKLGRAFL